MSFPHVVLNTWYESQEEALCGCFVKVTGHPCSSAGGAAIDPRGVA